MLGNLNSRRRILLAPTPPCRSAHIDWLRSVSDTGVWPPVVLWYHDLVGDGLHPGVLLLLDLIDQLGGHQLLVGHDCLRLRLLQAPENILDSFGCRCLDGLGSSIE